MRCDLHTYTTTGCTDNTMGNGKNQNRSLPEFSRGGGMIYLSKCPSVCPSTGLCDVMVNEFQPHPTPSPRKPSGRHSHENSGRHVRGLLLWVGIQRRASHRRSSRPPSHHPHLKEDAASVAAIGSSGSSISVTPAPVAVVRFQRPRGLPEVCGNGHLRDARGAAAGDRWGRRASTHLQREG